ncbi:hypothetical protein SERLADRAFT_410753 [Serpula lacrymans var. lacrymans S7.9]|uniref:Uncharacterized protein n=1 Tax=Serpula lacrymans var. lacrymans (strain S7.9) TaxID=578457 RepID=F8P7A8_SERL9|nr:uncharacterized protein SERLADRAFT_410753 [Serpula lacrymans var. lacrymans S7.9]EGO21324.1 hypothetical protein SERLADRAFT_410753 [Serpula lacrymans var. lacrymans S7.9]
MPIPASIAVKPRKHGKLVRATSRKLRLNDSMTLQPLSSTGSVSFELASPPAYSFTEDDRLHTFPSEDPVQAILRQACEGQHRRCDELLQTSLLRNDHAIRDIMPQKHGFVHTVLEAYNNHRSLIIRPDDVWLAILIQFKLFVDGNPELLRRYFVNHEGQKFMEISPGDRYSMNTMEISRQVSVLMLETIVDVDLREWILPQFSTTTLADTTTCAIVMMAAMKERFSHEYHLSSGIPRVTLDGEKKDWENILIRIERLKRYGIKAIAWYHLLRPVISRIIAACDSPNSAQNLEFWNRIVHYEARGSSSPLLTGWITAFCVFNEQGIWQGNPLNESRGQSDERKKLLRPANPISLTPVQFTSVYTFPERNRNPYLTLDGFPYPRIDSDNLPAGYGHLDIKLSDNGELFDTVLVAGSIGSQICSLEISELFRNGLRDTIRPVAGWWFFTKRRETGDDWFSAPPYS